MGEDEIALRVRAHGQRAAISALNSVKSAVERVGQSAKRSSDRMRDIGGPPVLRGIGAARTAVYGIGRAIESTASDVNFMRESFHNFGGSAMLRGVALTTAGITALGVAAAGVGVKTYAAAEQSGIAFDVLLKNSDRAKQMVADLRKFAEDSPFELKGVNQGAQRLLAMGFSAEEIMPMMKTLGNAASSGIVGLEEGLNRLTYAFGQIRAAGRMQGDEARQLEEMGINVRDALAKGFNIPKEELPKAIREGKLEGEKSIRILVNSIDKQMGGMMDRQADSWSGMWARFKEVSRNTMGDIAGALMKPLKPAGQAALKWFEKQGKKAQGIIASWSSYYDIASKGGMGGIKAAGWAADQTFGTGDTFSKMAVAGEAAMKNMKQIWNESIWPTLKSIVTDPKLRDGLIQIGRSVLNLITWMKDNPEKVQQMVGAIRYGLYSIIGLAFLLARGVDLATQFWDKLQEMKNGMPSWVVTALNFSNVLIMIITHFRTISEWIGKAVAALSSFKTMIGDGIEGTIGASKGGAFGGWVPGQAKGGVTTSGGATLVGENGPEIITASAGATVRPLQESDNPELEGVLGGTNVVINVSGADILHADRVANAVRRAVQDQLARA